MESVFEEYKKTADAHAEIERDLNQAVEKAVALGIERSILRAALSKTEKESRQADSEHYSAANKAENLRNVRFNQTKLLHETFDKMMIRLQLLTSDLSTRSQEDVEHAQRIYAALSDAVSTNKLKIDTELTCRLAACKYWLEQYERDSNPPDPTVPHTT